MRAGWIILLYVAAVVLLGTLLAPWIFLLAQHAGDYLTHQPFRRVYDRVLLVVAAASLWPLLRALGVGGWRDIGWVRSEHGWRDLGCGLGLGAGSLGLAAAVLLLADVWGWRGGLSAAALWAMVGKFALSALAVGLVEETFFRGGMQSALERGLTARWAVPVTSVVYSAVHFLKGPAVDVPAATVTWATGFEHLVRVLTHSWQIPEAAPGFVTLCLAGMILGWAFVWTRTLYLSIGLHAGWVFVLKLFSATTALTGQGSCAWFGTTLVGSPVVWPVLLALLVLVWWVGRRRPLPPS